MVINKEHTEPTERIALLGTVTIKKYHSILSLWGFQFICFLLPRKTDVSCRLLLFLCR